MRAAAADERITAGSLLAVSPTLSLHGYARANISRYGYVMLQCELELPLHTVYSWRAEIRHHERASETAGVLALVRGASGLAAIAMW